MNFAVLYSKKDEAGINIAKALKNHFLPQMTILEMNKDSIFEENIDKDERIKNAEFIIFATKHASKAEVPSLSLHAPGNWRTADFGGKVGKICPTSSLALKFLFQKLNENAKQMMPELEHNITLEVTHHGPLINKPCCFIEIGSKAEHWNNPKLGDILAKTITDFQNFPKWKEQAKKEKMKTAIALGGPHYCPNFNKIQLSQTNNIAISHIIPEHALPLSENLLKESIEKTIENLDLVIVDWKGCGKSEQRQAVINLLEKSSIPYERSERVHKQNP